METYGRERRHRYFTIATYKTVMATENLQDAYAHNIDPLRIGEFADVDHGLFYASDEQLSAFLDSSDKGAKVPKGKQRATVSIALGVKRKRPSGDTSADEGEEDLEARSTPKRGRPRKAPVADNSQVPRKRGRPRKHIPLPGEEEQTPKRRGRPPKGTKSTTTRDKDETSVIQNCTGVKGDIISQDVSVKGAVPVRPTMEERNDVMSEKESVSNRYSGEVDQSATMPESYRTPVTLRAISEASVQLLPSRAPEAVSVTKLSRST